MIGYTGKMSPMERAKILEFAKLPSPAERIRFITLLSYVVDAARQRKIVVKGTR